MVKSLIVVDSSGNQIGPLGFSDSVEQGVVLKQASERIAEVNRQIEEAKIEQAIAEQNLKVATAEWRQLSEQIDRLRNEP